MSILDNLTTAVFKPTRQFGPYSIPADGVAPLIPFSAQCTLKEIHTDTLEITEHPVEQGAAITDHAFKRPAELMVMVAWSNSNVQSTLSSLAGLASPVVGDESGDFNYMRTLYTKLLKLQANRIPFDVTTGKRKYRNMLIRSMTAPTDDTTEHSLFITMVLKEIIIVQTQAVISTSANVQSNPESNAPTINQGNQQVISTSGELGQASDGTPLIVIHPRGTP